MATHAGFARGFAMWQPVGDTRISRHRWGGVTPEIYFNKAIDNSRLVKVADPKRELAFPESVVEFFEGGAHRRKIPHAQAAGVGHRVERTNQLEHRAQGCGRVEIVLHCLGKRFPTRVHSASNAAPSLRAAGFWST